ncbi:MAG: hypothetical protein CMP41_03920 [Rickettsiales bacterium]|nr:hypothetical protein [Rickettsiales bacterium]
MKELNKKVLKYLKDNFLIKPDNEQKVVLNSIENVLKKNLFSFRINKFFRRSYHGIFLWGNVGSGKSVIAEAIDKILPKNFSVIFHFNKFITLIQNKKNSELEKSEKIFKNRLIIIDELQINNLADAILIFNFLEEAIKKNIFVIFTSNKAPNKLYKSIIQKKLLEKLSNFFLKNFFILEFKSNIDYRLGRARGNHYFFFNLNDNNKKQNVLRKKLIGNEKIIPTKIIKDKKIELKLSESKNLIDCTFDEICGSNLGNSDYEFICNNFDLIIIRNIPLLNEDRKDLIARFISLIDNIYEKKNFLSISSSYPLTKIFCAKTKKYEFKRTYSRLMEIGSKSYISNVLEKS